MSDVMTERENYLLAFSGKQPAWVPEFETAAEMIIPSILMTHFITGEMRDYFGVPWCMNENGPMVDTHQPPVLDDIERWREFVHFPDVEAFDWETAAAMDLAQHDPDKAIVLMPNMGGGTIFMPLMNMMGFEEGLCAFIEEPEMCQEFLDCATTFYEQLVPYFAKYYHPDAIIVGDDLCSEMGPFISMDTYAEVLKPFYQREIDAVRKEGIYAELHMCGKCEQFVDDFVSMGVRSWQPAQALNDLQAIKARYGNDLVLVGGWATNGEAWRPGAPEQAVRVEVRKCIDELAAGGGMVLWTGGNVGVSEDQVTRNAWVSDEAALYGRQFYRCA